MSLRLRLTLGTVALLSIAIAVALVTAYLLVRHELRSEIDRSLKTRAAAVTSVGIGTTAIQVGSFTMDVNRPFFCAIRDDTSGSLLFMGMILNPS